MRGSRIVFFLSGSIAAFKAAQVISKLVQDGAEVQTVATAAALKFIGAATLEGLTGKQVLTDLWQEGRAMDHIALSRWADFGVLCPASANSIAKIANGIADDLLGAMVLAWPRAKPLHVFPAMNVLMFENARTQENLVRLAQQGLLVHGTHAGNLACGEQGAGRLLEPEEILLALAPPRRGAILLTAGATREPIDGIRFLSNVSTGQTGAALCDRLEALGWQVTYLHGSGAALPARSHKQISYGSFTELDESLRAELGSHRYAAVIHCAAVSDYSVNSVNDRSPDEAIKLSSAGELNLRLKANFKILPRLKEYSANKQIRVIGFKLTLGQSEDQQTTIARALLGPSVDAVVANDWSQLSQDRAQSVTSVPGEPARLVESVTGEPARHSGRLITPAGAEEFADLAQLAESLHQLLSKDGGDHGSVS